MGLIVQKYGGTSVANVERIQNIAKRITKEKEKGNDVIVVVSAMGKSTDHLVDLAKRISANPSKRELDMLLTTGEQITISLLAMALIDKGYAAVSLTGWQAGIKTEPVHGNARIIDLETNRVQKELEQGKIVVVAGFQGITEDGSISTLGRGGSDTTAVALAAAFKAERCEIFTDVTGVFTTDPCFVKEARKLAALSYDEMLELAHLGAGILHPRAVEFAKNYQIKLEVRSSIEKERGTIIEEDVHLEQNLVVRGVAFEDDITRVTVLGLPDSLAGLSVIFSQLAKNQINVDIIIQSTTAEQLTNLSFSIKNNDLEETVKVLENCKSRLNYKQIETETKLAKVSIVGSGMVSNPGVAAEMFAVLAENNIAVKMVSTSEIKVSTVIEQEQMIVAIEKLHTAFKLAKQPSESMK